MKYQKRYNGVQTHPFVIGEISPLLSGSIQEQRIVGDILADLIDLGRKPRSNNSVHFMKFKGLVLGIGCYTINSGTVIAVFQESISLIKLVNVSKVIPSVGIKDKHQCFKAAWYRIKDGV
jgi:hypothetical protein